MDDQLKLLIELQHVDRKIHVLMAERGKLPGMLDVLARKREASAAEFAGARTALEEAQKRKRDRDRDLEAGVQKVEKLKARTGEIKTNKEYQALLKEIEAAEQDNKTVEDDIIRLMETAEATAVKIKDAEQRSAAESAAIDAEQKELEATVARLNKDLQDLERERQDAAGRIDAAAMAQYEKLHRTRAGTAVVEAMNETCSGCFMRIPPQVYVNVKKNSALIPCPQCSRILFYKA